MSEEGNSAKKSFVSNFNKRNNHSTTVSHISSKDASREITHLDNTPVRKLHKKSPCASNMAHRLGNIKVVCRIRPLNKKEKDLKDAMILEVTDEKTLTYKNPIPYQGSPSYQFTFDRVFGSDSAQQDIYEAVSRPIVESAFEGFNGTILTYGQTGSGKTYTMQGLINDRNSETDGIMPRMAYHIFDHMKDAAEGAQPVVKFSAIELYSEKIKDLLKPEKTSLKIRQDKSKGISIEDLTEIVPSKKDELLELFRTSVLNRSHPGTSSKSHMIVMITISQSNIQDLSGKSGKICMADLADYEKMSKASHDTRMTTSAKLVNKSLCTLGNIIKLLSESRNNLHIPYRESNLTRILQDSLGGNSRTTLLITCSPSRADYLETLQTLKFGMRARLVNNTVKLNTEMTIPALQKLLAKSEKENEEKGRRISVLENMLKENGLFVNMSSRDDNSHFEENKSDIVRDNNARSIMGELEYHPESELLEPEDEFLNKTLSSFSDIAPDIDENEFEEEENVLELQKSLEEEQKKSREHADRNEELMRELEEVKQKLFEAENDNKALTRKLALTNMKVQGFELRVKQRDEQIEKLEGFRTDLLEENRELQRKVDYYMELLKTEEESVEQLNNISIQKELKELEQSMSQDSISQKSDVEKDEGDLKIEGVINRMAKTISLRFGVKEQKDIDSLSTTLLERFKNLLELQGKTDAKRETELTLEVENLKQDNENLRKEVDLHKDKYEVLLKDFEGILRDYEDVARGRFPLFDQMLQSMVKAALTKARNSFEDEKNILMKGIQDKIITLKNMENRLEKEQGRHRSLQHKLDEGQKENVQMLKNMQNQISSKLSPSDMPKRAQTVKGKEKDGSGIKQKNLKLEVTKAITKDFGSLKNTLRKQSTSGNKENENSIQSSANKTPAEILEGKPVLASSATLKPNRNKNKRYTVDNVDFTQRKDLNSLKRKLDFDDETH